MREVHFQLGFIEKMSQLRAFLDALGYALLSFVSRLASGAFASPANTPPASWPLNCGLLAWREEGGARRWRKEVEVDSGGFTAFFLVVVRLLSRPKKQQAYNNKFFVRNNSTIRPSAEKRCPHRFRREETPWAILHLHLQTTPTLSSLHLQLPTPHSQLSTFIRRSTNATESR